MLVLQVLADRAMHGYELVQAIAARTAGQLEFGEGCIYPILHRLEAAGVLAGKREQAGGRKPRGLSPDAQGTQASGGHRPRLARSGGRRRTRIAGRRTCPTRTGLKHSRFELRRQRLPADYSARLMEELADHVVGCHGGHYEYRNVSRALPAQAVQCTTRSAGGWGRRGRGANGGHGDFAVVVSSVAIRC